MSATYDKSQKIAFVYKSFHKLYHESKAQAQAQAQPQRSPAVPPALPVGSGAVLKAAQVNQNSFGHLNVAPFTAPHFIGKRVARPSVLPDALMVAPTNPALEGLKDNLKALNDLHSRLRFMLKELEDLIKD
ncbi:hypothetical protein WDW86_19255 [Bdellovibrionota bacterium FG-2]